MLRIDDWDQCCRRCNTGHKETKQDRTGEPYVRYVGSLIKYCPVCDRPLVQGRCADCGKVEVDIDKEAKLQGSPDTQ